MAKVLVVEDEKDIAEVIKVSFETEGFTVQSAFDGLEALKKIELSPPDIIILDIMMPRVDGWEVLLKIKSEPSTQKIPVIILSAKSEDVSKLTAFKLGVDDYLVKPFSPQELVARARLVLERRQFGAETTGKIEKLAVEAEGKVVFLNPSEIVFFHSHDFQTDIYLTERVLATSASLTDFEIKLRGWKFFRTHRSYLVNLDRVKELIYLPNRTCLLVMEDREQTRVPVSRRTVKELKAKLGIVV